MSRDFYFNARNCTVIVKWDGRNKWKCSTKYRTIRLGVEKGRICNIIM